MMKKNIYLTTLLLFLSIILISCEKDENNDITTSITAKVYHKYVPFKLPLNNTIINALKIQESNSNEWEIVTEIKDFYYEENYEYNLKLEKTILANPPLDGSNTNYKLLQIISKEPK